MKATTIFKFIGILFVVIGAVVGIGMLAGGFGSAVETWYAQEELQVSTLAFGIPDMFVQHGSRGKLLKYLGLLPEQMATRISVFLGSLHGVKRNDG